MKYFCGTCGKSDRDCECGRQEWQSPVWNLRDMALEGWTIPHLAEHMPELVLRWNRMATATHNSRGYPLTDKQRAFAANIVKQVETHLGTAVEE